MVEHHIQNIILQKQKEYNVKIDIKNFFDQSINNDIKTYENIRKIATDYPYFKENYKMIPIDLKEYSGQYYVLI